MAKNKTKKKKPNKINRAMQAFIKTEEEYLEHLISVSNNAITGHGGSVDELFKNQANRVKKELKELRARK